MEDILLFLALVGFLLLVFVGIAVWAEKSKSLLLFLVSGAVAILVLQWTGFLTDAFVDGLVGP